MAEAGPDTLVAQEQLPGWPDYPDIGAQERAAAQPQKPAEEVRPCTGEAAITRDQHICADRAEGVMARRRACALLRALAAVGCCTTSSRRITGLWHDACYGQGQYCPPRRAPSCDDQGGAHARMHPRGGGRPGHRYGGGRDADCG